MTEVLAAEDLRKSYGDTAALAGVSLSVGAGEVFALIGPNGAGKTTLVRALTGTTEPDAGTVSVFGTEPGAVDRRRLGLLPQSFDPPERLTARELLEYYAGLYDAARDPAAVLEEVGIAGAAGTWYERLSGGQRRRTCVGIALVNDPDLLFLDEPTTGIDPAGRHTVRQLVEGLAAAGTTVVLTTHDMAEAERLGDRVGLLADGELLAVGPPAELVAEYGGPTRLVVETDAGVDALAEAGIEAESTDDGLIVSGVTPGEIDAVVAALDERGVEYGALTWTEPDLEDAFLRLTGRPSVGATGATEPAAGSEPALAGRER